MELEGARSLDAFMRSHRHDAETSRQTSALILYRLNAKLEEERKKSAERAREVEELQKEVGERRQQETLLRAERDIERMLVAKARMLITEADVSRALALADYEQEVRTRERLAVKLHETEAKLSSEQEMFRHFLLLLEAEKLKTKELNRRVEGLEEAKMAAMEEAARQKRTISELQRSGEKQKRLFSAERRSLNKKILNIQLAGAAASSPSSSSPPRLKPAKRSLPEQTSASIPSSPASDLKASGNEEAGEEERERREEEEEETKQVRESLSPHEDDAQEVERTYEQLKALEDLYRDLQERNMRVEVELEQAKEEGRRREGALGAELEEIRIREQEVSKKLEESERRAGEQEEALVSVNESLRGEQEKVERLSSSLSSVEEQLEQAKQELSAAGQQLEDLSMRATELSLQASMLSKSLKETEGKRAEAEASLHAAQEDNKMLKKQVGWQQEEAREAEERISKLETEIRMKEILIKSLEIGERTELEVLVLGELNEIQVTMERKDLPSVACCVLISWVFREVPDLLVYESQCRVARRDGRMDWPTRLVQHVERLVQCLQRAVQVSNPLELLPC
ncbi:hypothetical protein GUITHDRAFT_136258 [Guillardia theta CCMP2712]|uniref:Uncharacterized protein n=1 Tax=Guillardia theta (strain CCMP2712) TaxID=905079 RepID=L1JLM6_GUITC|nr:hypothetical protein GUITHDRAFT_136258 [Guillardia theta CCMP2712]EKX49079.1 hypothetical protein GUITHDRAFT_136258 [Guillardia theta CCMP2712]|eukprot:XP_005836059.1 hypothetical protein GUITHDRAFT_136258 [Guillardia theta CCMP2712]